MSAGGIDGCGSEALAEKLRVRCLLFGVPPWPGGECSPWLVSVAPRAQDAKVLKVAGRETEKFLPLGTLPSVCAGLIHDLSYHGCGKGSDAWHPPEERMFRILYDPRHAALGAKTRNLSTEFEKLVCALDTQHLARSSFSEVR